LPGTTEHMPAVTVINNYAEIVVTGIDGQFYSGYIYLPSETFSGWYWIGGSSPDAPAFATIPDGLITEP
jgi:hypothetical protein